jgi:hypothetical protein
MNMIPEVIDVQQTRDPSGENAGELCMPSFVEIIRGAKIVGVNLGGS